MKTQKTYLWLIHLTVFMLCVANLSAQFNWVKVGVDGLTCSQCSRSVELSIRKLNFVSNVEMNLELTEGKISFIAGSKVNIEKIAQAVIDAGFSVRYLSAGFNFENTSVNSGYCHSFEGNQYQFLKMEPKVLNGETTLLFVGKKFMPPKKFKDWKKNLIPACDKSKGIVFYVTL